MVQNGEARALDEKSVVIHSSRIMALSAIPATEDEIKILKKEAKDQLNGALTET
jgi:hypothetical protein